MVYNTAFYLCRITWKYALYTSHYCVANYSTVFAITRMYISDDSIGEMLCLEYYSDSFDQQKVSLRTHRPGSASTTHSCGHIRSVPSELRTPLPDGMGLSDYYQKYTEAYGIPIVSSSDVSDDALRRACYTTRFLFADRLDIRQSYYEHNGRVGVISINEVITDIPEFSYLPSSWNERARGLGATPSRLISVDAEENLLWTISCFMS